MAISMNNKLLVSVIIPTYNRSTRILNALYSVFSQTYKNIEIIIVDDGSTDNTYSVLEPYLNRVKYIFQKNSGPAKARNEGSKIAAGKYITFLDSDDFWKNNFVEVNINILERCSSDVVCCINNTRIIDDNNKEITTSFSLAPLHLKQNVGILENTLDLLSTRNILFNQCTVMLKKYFNESGMYNEKLRILEDYDLSLRIAKFGKFAYNLNTLVDYSSNSKDGLSQIATINEIEVEKTMINIQQDFINSNRNYLNANIINNMEFRIKLSKINIYIKSKKGFLSIPIINLLFSIIVKIIKFSWTHWNKFPKPIIKNC